MERRIFLKIGTGAALGGALAACGGGGHHGGGGNPPPPPPPEPVRVKVAVGWNNVALAAIRATRPSPPMAARSLAIVHTAMYDAWAAYDPVALGTRHGGSLRRPLSEQTLANQQRAFSYAAYAALLDQFPGQKAAFDVQMAVLAYPPGAASSDVGVPPGLGTLAARNVIEHAHADGANQLGNLTAGGLPFADYSGYVARNAPLVVAQATPRSAIADPAHWQPLTYQDASGVLRTQTYLLPFWGQVKPFALASGSQYRPAGPAVFGSAALTAQVRHVVATQAGLTETQKVMADFWAGSKAGELPSGYWMQFAQFVSLRDHLDEAGDIKLLFALSNALFDAGIAAWDAKRAYDSVRPITAVRYVLYGTTIQGYGFDGPAGGLRTIAGEAWVPYHLPTFPTPSFPDHVSGHSTYSAASAEVLKLFTGSDAFTHSVTAAPRSMLFDPALPTSAVTLAWDSFSYAACEAGTSRVYAGVHFENADVMGRRLGEQVGATVFARAQNYWLGRA
ncbi:MAG: vanadium-dependent haloperoxidase [Pseudomonadota bacterium]